MYCHDHWKAKNQKQNTRKQNNKTPKQKPTHTKSKHQHKPPSSDVTVTSVLRAVLLRGFRLFGVALHQEPKGTKRQKFASFFNGNLLMQCFTVFAGPLTKILIDSYKGGLHRVSKKSAGFRC